VPKPVLNSASIDVREAAASAASQSLAKFFLQFRKIYPEWSIYGNVYHIRNPEILKRKSKNTMYLKIVTIFRSVYSKTLKIAYKDVFSVRITLLRTNDSGRG